MNLDNQSIYIFLGGIAQLLLWLSYKILKNNKIFIICFLITVIIAYFGYSNWNRPTLQMKNGNAASWTLFPLLFMIYYWIFRHLFLIIFGNEPLMTGYMQSSWEQGEYRRLHIGDALFTILTLILPFLTTTLLT